MNDKWQVAIVIEGNLVLTVLLLGGIEQFRAVE